MSSSDRAREAGAGGALLAEAWPLVDHHVHGVVTGALDAAGFEALISESRAEPPAGTSHFEAPIGLAIRRECAQLLGLEPHAPSAEYLAARAQLGTSEVNRRLVGAAGLELLLVDTGHRPREVATPAEMADLAGAPAAEIVRMEAVAEELAARCGGPSEWRRVFGETLAEAATHAVGLKTIVAYRYGFDLDSSRPGAIELARGLDSWFGAGGDGFGDDGAAMPRLSDPAVLRHVIHEGLELASAEGLVMQAHAGFGDTDLTLHRADPVVFTPWVRLAAAAKVVLSFLHCYPYHRQAGYLAEVFPNVYFDVGCILNYAGPSATGILAEALELAPFTKMLYSSDAYGAAELVYLGAVQFRRSLAGVLGRFVEEGECTMEDARHIVALVSRDNAFRVYPVQRAEVTTPASPERSEQPERPGAAGTYDRGPGG